MINLNLKSARIVLLALPLLVSACALDEPTKFKQSTVRVQEEKIEHTIAAADLNQTALAGLAAHYTKHGDGPMNVTLTYDPQSKVNTAMKASDMASEVSAILRKEGVHDLHLSILPVQNSGELQALVSYTGYNALAPEDCEILPGIENRNVVAEDAYQIGCSVDTLFARQIARPKDLLGQENGAYSDGRRAANVGELYRGGLGNQPLGGETASGN